MRIEATIPDPSSERLTQLAGELGVTKSQIVEEALALFTKAVLEARRGNRLAIVEAASNRPICEVVSPSLSQVEWTLHRERIVMAPRAIKKIQELIENPPKPTAALRKLMRKAR